MAKIEAKLGAAFSEGQLSSYVTDFQHRSSGGLLLVLVPRHRAKEVTASTASAFALAGIGPWRLAERSNCAVAVISWEDILDALGTVCSEPFGGDLAQFRAMYRVLNGDDIEPLASDAALRAWREREGVFVNLVDRVTRRLTQESKVLPMATEVEPEPKGYQRRYVCRPLGTEQPCFSLGVRDAFAGHITPIWLRFHHDTAKFAVIRARLAAPSVSQRLVESGGHMWTPLDIPLEADGDGLVDALVSQAEDIIKVAYQPLP